MIALNSSGYVELSLSLVAACQRQEKPRQSVLAEKQRSKILAIWWYLYTTSLTLTGAAVDPPPSRYLVQEAMGKSLAAMEIGSILEDPVLVGFGVGAGAWIPERMGQKASAESAPQALWEGFEWPPVWRKPECGLTFRYPQYDNIGLTVPMSADSLFY